MKRKISVLLAAAFLSAVLLPGFPAAAAGWESGISAASVSAAAPSSGFSAQAYVTEVLRLVNQERTGRGLQPLSETVPLNAVASIRAGESSVCFSHTRPNGSTPASLYAEYGVAFRLAGENLSYGYLTPSSLVSAWMLSPEHRSNILNAGFTNTGIGVYQSAGGAVYCAELFDQP